MANVRLARSSRLAGLDKQILYICTFQSLGSANFLRTKRHKACGRSLHFQQRRQPTTPEVLARPRNPWNLASIGKGEKDRQSHSKNLDQAKKMCGLL
jgi:hypothetical protein